MLKLIVSGPECAFASWIAARNVQTPADTAHTPLPTLLSHPSPVLLTTKVNGAAGAGPAVAPPRAGARRAPSVARRLAPCWRSRTSRQPSPLTSSPAGTAEHGLPAR